MAILLLRLGYAAAFVVLTGWSAVAHVGLAAGGASIFSLLTSDFVLGGVLPAQKSNATLSLSKAAFDWNNIDTTEKGACGMRKCFFRSSKKSAPAASTASTAELQQREGYLVAKQCTKDAKYDYLDRMMRTWDVTKRLEREDRFRHFLLEPPQKVGTPPKQNLAALNSIAKTPGSKDENEQYYGNETSPMNLVVQRVKEAPSPALIPRCYFTPRGRGGRFFFDHNSGSMKEFDNLVANKTQFLHTLQEELLHLFDVLVKEPRLYNDFQFLVDSEARIHHIDLDRIEQSGYTAPTKQAFDNCFNSMIGNIIRILDGDYRDMKTKKRRTKKRGGNKVFKKATRR
jgi:hypothetical protein